MKNFNIDFVVEYEGYNGYDHKTNFSYSVEAMNEKSALNKAKKLLKKNAGGYLQRGYIINTSISDDQRKESR